MCPLLSVLQFVHLDSLVFLTFGDGCLSISWHTDELVTQDNPQTLLWAGLCFTAQKEACVFSWTRGWLMLELSLGRSH